MLTMYRLRMPFKVAFRHASATRNETQSLWVEARASDGTIGYGESCPREYVTGESIESAARFFAAHRDNIVAEVVDLVSLRAWVTSHRDIIDHDPAAWCAIELALLDLFAKQTHQSVEQYLGLPELAGEFHYSAVLGDNELPAFQQQLAKYQAARFSDFKVKLSGKLDHDRAKLSAVSSAGAKRMRLDANNLWQNTQQAAAYLKQLEHPFFAVEEPIQTGDYEGMAELAKALNVKIILDESFTRVDQLEQLPALPGPWILNLRVSKLGGLLRSLEAAERARISHVPVVIGAQVGETSLLTRVALTVAAHARDTLLAQEGAFGTLLLSADVCQPPLMFGGGGIMVLPPQDRFYGFGLRLETNAAFLGPIN
jgi:L-Ala-D/L-Glu epimerase